MKKLAYFFALVAAAVALSSCVKELQESISGPEVTVSFTAGAPQTRTAFTEPDGNTYPVLWTENDQKVAISLNYAKIVSADVSPAADFKSASFTATFAESTAPFTFYLMSPASAAVNISKDYKDWTVDVPTVQTPLAKSVDEAAQILVSKSGPYEEIPAKVTFGLDHMTAYGKLTLTNLALDGAEIEAVDLTAETPWAGRWYYYPETGEAKANPGATTITIDTKAKEDLWFACAPVDLSGTKLTVVVKTDKGTFTKEITLPAERKFESGKIARFNVDMADIKPAAPVEYVLVKDVAELTVGSKVIIAAAAFDKAISTTQNTNNRPETAVVKEGDKIVDPGSSVEIFTVEEGTTAGTFAFKASGTEGYIYAVASKNNLKTAAAKSEEGDWTVTIADNSTVIGNKKTERFIRYNANSALFSSYAATSSVKDSVAIYKLAAPAPEKKLTVERLWGKYPTAWPTFTTNFDRCATMDENYIYVAKQGSGQKGVWAIPLDGNLANAVDVCMDGVESAGTHYTSCVRTIWDPATQKHILLLCNLALTGGDHLYLYAYENGINAAPTKLLSEYTLPTWAERRFGDFFTVVGDWSKGAVWFRTNNADASTTARWNIENGKLKNQTPDGFNYGYGASRGKGSFYQYDMNAKTALLVTDQIGMFYDLNSSEGVAWDNIANEAMKNLFGFTPFEFEGKKYIAFLKLYNAARSWLTIIADTGDFKADLETFQKTGDNIVYQAAVQIEEEGPSTNVMSGATYSDQTSGNCTAVVKEDGVYIMGHHHNVGLSLFKMSMK